MNFIIETIIRWRTWIVNTLAAVLLVLPDILNGLVGYDWSAVVPINYMPYVTLAILILNIWMRPRPAAMAHDPEVKIAEALKTDEPIEHV